MFEIVMASIFIIFIYIIFKSIKSKQNKDSASLQDHEKSIEDYYQHVEKYGISFNGADFCKLYNIDLVKKRREIRNNPNLLATMGVGKVFGGTIGAAYSAAGFISTALQAAETSSFSPATNDIYFHRKRDNLSDYDMTRIKLNKLMQVKGVFSDVDFQKANCSIAWNNGDCSFTNVGKKSEGGVGELELNDWQKAAVILMTNIVSNSVLPIEKTYEVLDGSISKLSDEDIKSAGLKLNDLTDYAASTTSEQHSEDEQVGIDLAVQYYESRLQKGKQVKLSLVTFAIKQTGGYDPLLVENGFMKRMMDYINTGEVLSIVEGDDFIYLHKDYADEFIN